GLAKRAVRPGAKGEGPMTFRSAGAYRPGRGGGHEARNGRRTDAVWRAAGAAAAILLSTLLAGCGEKPSGPVTISAIGSAPELVNPNLIPLDPPSAILLASTAQGLLQFHSDGQIESAL